MSKITKTQCVFSLHITTYISVVVCVITLINTLNSERTPFFVCGMHLSNTENNDIACSLEATVLDHLVSGP